MSKEEMKDSMDAMLDDGRGKELPQEESREPKDRQGAGDDSASYSLKKDLLNRDSVDKESCSFFMNPKDAEFIRILTEVRRGPAGDFSQGDFISFLIDQFIKGREEKVEQVINDYKRQKENAKDQWFSL